MNALVCRRDGAQLDQLRTAADHADHRRAPCCSLARVLATTDGPRAAGSRAPKISARKMSNRTTSAPVHDGYTFASAAVRAASIASAATLATGQLKKSDQLDVELHRPADLPAFILVKWPSAPSVAGPDTFADLVARRSASWPMPASP